MNRPARSQALGFSDLAIERLAGGDGPGGTTARKAQGVRPHLAQIDTLAAEFPAETNYLYSTYRASADDVTLSRRRRRSWCSARAPTASGRASSSTGAA